MSRSEDIARIVADACNALLAKTNSPIRVCAGDDVPFAAAKAIEAVSAPSALPVEGWKMVPVEPTEKMVQAGVNKLHGSAGGSPYPVAAETFRAMLSASPPEPVSGWRDIATAPRDGTDILVYFSGRLRGVWKVSWENIHGDRTPTDGIWCVDDNKHGPYALRGYSAGDDTLWMPLPSPPSELGVK
jgi:hypothetical protein